MNACIDLAERLGISPETVLELWAERAAIREYDGGQSRADAEAGALDDVRAELVVPMSAIGERKGPRSAPISASVSDVLADTHKR